MDKKPNPWPYYRQVEQQVADVAQVIQLVPENGGAFGNRMAELLLVIGSEIDSNLRIFTRTGERGRIDKYRAYLKEHCPRITQVHLRVEGLDVEAFHPFPSFDESPAWWDAYNHVKHNRYANAAEANLKHLMESFAALYVVDLYLSFDTSFFGQGYESRFIEDGLGLHQGKLAHGAFSFGNRDHMPNRWYFTAEPHWTERHVEPPPAPEEPKLSP